MARYARSRQPTVQGHVTLCGLPELARALQIGCGKGVLGQLSLETGLPQNVVELTLVAFIGYNAFSVSSHFLCLK